MGGVFFGSQEIEAIRGRAAKYSWARRGLERIRLELELDREELLAGKAGLHKRLPLGTAFLHLALCSRLFNAWYREAAENILSSNEEVRSWRAKQTLDFVLAFDFLDELDDELWAQTTERILVPIGEQLLNKWRGGSNHQTSFNLGLLCIGLLTGRDDFIGRVVSDPERGFPYHLAHGIDADGFWYEQSFASYHIGTLDRLLKTRWIADRNGIALGRDEVLLRMLDTLPGMALPGGVFPLIGDVGGESPPPLYRAGPLELAYAMYKIPWIGWALRRVEREELWSLLVGQEIDQVKVPVPQSKRYDATGLCVLKNGEPETYWDGKGSGVTVTFGPHGDWHGHAGKLAIEYRYDNQYLVRDHGHSGNYNHPIHRLWYMTTLAHSTIVLDGCNQSFTWCHDRPERQKKESGICHAHLFRDDVSACTVSADFAFPGCLLLRTLFLTPAYLLDIMECHSVDGAEHTFDWVLHTTGTMQSDLPFEPGRIADIRTQPPPSPEPAVYSCGNRMPLSYDYIREVEVLETGDRWDVNVMNSYWAADIWKITGQVMRFTMLGEAGTTVYKGVCPAAARDIQDPVLLARRQTRHTNYIALHVPGDRELSLECLRNEAGTIVCRVGEDGRKSDILLKQDSANLIEINGKRSSEQLDFFTC